MQQEWGGSLCAWRIPVQCYSHNMTMMAYIKSHSANNPLLHAIPKQKPVLKSGAMRQHRYSLMPARSVQRGKQRGSSELGCTMNADWHQEATLGPQSLLKVLAACQGSSGFTARREPCWQLVRNQGVTGRPGGNNIFQNAQANSPTMGHSKDHRYGCSSCPQSRKSHPSQQSAESRSADLHGRDGDTVLCFMVPSCQGRSTQAKFGFYLLSHFEFFYLRKENVVHTPKGILAPSAFLYLQKQNRTRTITFT